MSAQLPASGGRQANHEAPAFAMRTPPPAPARRAREAAREREPEPGAAVVGVAGALAAEARLEDRGGLVRRDAGAIVLHAPLEPLAVARDANDGAAARVAARVLDQRREDPLDQLRLRRRAHRAGPIAG